MGPGFLYTQRLNYTVNHHLKETFIKKCPYRERFPCTHIPCPFVPPSSLSLSLYVKTITHIEDIIKETPSSLQVSLFKVLFSLYQLESSQSQAKKLSWLPLLGYHASEGFSLISVGMITWSSHDKCDKKLYIYIYIN